MWAATEAGPFKALTPAAGGSHQLGGSEPGATFAASLSDGRDSVLAWGSSGANAGGFGTTSYTSGGAWGVAYTMDVKKADSAAAWGAVVMDVQPGSADVITASVITAGLATATASVAPCSDYDDLGSEFVIRVDSESRVHTACSRAVMLTTVPIIVSVAAQWVELSTTSPPRLALAWRPLATSLYPAPPMRGQSLLLAPSQCPTRHRRRLSVAGTSARKTLALARRSRHGAPKPPSRQGAAITMSAPRRHHGAKASPWPSGPSRKAG